MQSIDPKSGKNPPSLTSGDKYDLLSIKPLKILMKKRWFQPLFMTLNLIFFLFVIFTALFGTPVGNANFSAIFVWMAWWSILIIILVPFTGRFWCTICPIPAFGEWLQRGQPVSKDGKRDKLHGLKKKWPKSLSNMWPSTIGFLLVATFTGHLTTSPKATAILLIGLILFSIGISYVFRKRTFCRYLCPVGGFIGLYSQAAPLELRVKDEEVCRNHKSKDCILGNECGYGCPWMESPGNIKTNTNCGLCMECLKTCPKDNIALNIRPFGYDLAHSVSYRMDEAYRSQIMLGASLLYSVVLLGPYSELKDLANFTDIFGMISYATFFIGVLVVIIPSFFWLEALIIKKLTEEEVALDRSDIFKSYAYTTIPLGLLTWIGFSFSFLLPNWVYIINVINDPFGWGWHLLGLNYKDWEPIFTLYIPLISTIFIIMGLLISLKLTDTITKDLYGSGVPLSSLKGNSIHSIFLFIFTITLLYSFTG